MPRPRLSLSLGPTAIGSRAVVELVRRTADLEFAEGWASEVAGPDAMTILGALAPGTDMDLGVAVVPVQTRTAFVLAMSALSLADLTGGRFTLGIGASSPPLVERFGGIAWDRPLQHVREMALALRPVLDGERGSLDGDHVRMGGYRYPAPAPTPVPLFIGSLNRQSLRLTGELADGLCLNQFGPHHLEDMLAEVRTGATAAGRELPADFPVVARLFVGVTDDVPAMRAVVRQTFAPYIATPGYNRFYDWMGYTETAREIARAARSGDREAMVAAFTDDVVDDLFLLGDADTVAARIADYTDAGVTVPALEPLATSLEDAESALRAIAAAWA
ncbi:LLM class flavin-dependent oxidoreductase [Salsipaludibacter albus]|uniref:LLM class flavin-dependent oxidoreductase n=1 Tax=Salsipaludibacter albus TaxID=2849650 RepID=UPI001EE3C1B3|nr:LLM class flavin-dependent oxidoreductase [Salsipaludibacter albus]MBY5163559.1 LLM class flavin-dependent oxidoreductase [Salsipaludibacter albus]